MEQKRSAIPKVVGILMIVFAGLGLVHSLISLIQAQLLNEGFEGHERMAQFAHVALIFGLVDLGVGVLHLAAGLRALGYKESAPRLTMLYGVLKIVTTVGLLVVTYAFMRSSLEGAAAASPRSSALASSSPASSTWRGRSSRWC